ncbi:MAG: Tat pathway signal protein, partial [Ruminococcus sp.]|nr:Tat pathway signal protein [Ruminococcus sp.]
MNLNVLTDLLSEEAYLDREGEVRSVTITELGFSSGSGERLQAAAFAYCYHIVEDNPYVDAFLMNRQTDAPEEVMAGMSFGVYEYDHTAKYI